jgi:hypothetical protein
MSGQTEQKVEKSSSERISELIAELTPNQLRYAVARMEFSTAKEAAESVDLDASTVYNWNGEVKELVGLMAKDLAATALAIRKRNLAKAMMVKAAGLDSDDESIRQKVASELIEWELGKATQRQEFTGEGGGALIIKIGSPDDSNG